MMKHKLTVILLLLIACLPAAADDLQAVDSLLQAFHQAPNSQRYVVGQEIGDICHGKEVKGKRISGFNVWAPNIVLIMETVCDGRFLINGFRNKDIRNLIFPDIGDWKKQSALTSRVLKKLRTFGLVRKNSRSRQYHVSSKGRRIMGALIELRRQQFPALAANIS